MLNPFRRHNRRPPKPRLPAEPEGYYQHGLWQESDIFHPRGSRGFIQLREIQDGQWGGQRQNSTCSILAVAIDNAWVRVDRRGRVARFRMFDPLTGLPEQISVTTRLTGLEAEGALGWAEKAYAVWLRKHNRVAVGLTAWQETIDGVSPDEAITAFTGRRAVIRDAGNLPTVADIEMALSQGKTAIVWTYMVDDPQLYWNHAYRVIGVSGGTVLLQNPHAWDGAGKTPWGDPNDGVVGVSAGDWDRLRLRAAIG